MEVERKSNSITPKPNIIRMAKIQYQKKEMFYQENAKASI